MWDGEDVSSAALGQLLGLGLAAGYHPCHDGGGFSLNELLCVCNSKRSLKLLKFSASDHFLMICSQRTSKGGGGRISISCGP